MKERYANCRERIGQIFYQGEDPGEILQVTDTGDRHLHGKSVVRIETSRGRILYYKPRDCRSTGLLGDLTCQLFGVRMVPEQVTGDGYAFQKAVEKQLPETDAQRAGYYERLGLLTALFYALGSTDMHKGNIICAAEYPVVIDTETLLCAKAQGVGGTGEFSVDYGEIFPDYRTSVGECMVLPRFYGFWQTSPLILDQTCRPEEYVPFFTKGFADGYQRIREKRKNVFRILQNYADVPFRYLLRSTAYYAVKIRQYQNAKGCPETEEVFESLKKGLSEADVKRWEAVLAWERSCICEGDIPYFCLVAGGSDLMGDMHAPALIPEYLERSPIACAHLRIRQMCEEDLAVQTSYIRASLKHIDGWERSGLRDAAIPDSQNSETELSIQEAVDEVKETLTMLWDERIPLSQGRCLWHTPLVRGKTGSLFGLAEGFSGIAVFVHACARSQLITGEAACIAQKLTSAVFLDLVSFGEYLLNMYPQPPEERVISRRFNGGFDDKDGLTGFLWALKQVRDEDFSRADRILEGFEAWNIGRDGMDDQEGRAFLWHVIADSALKTEKAPGFTDCLENGTAGKAAAENDLKAAGIILKKMVSRKKKRGCYKVYPGARHSYFLPAFLRGNTGIAYMLLLYAQKCIRHFPETT